MNDSVSYQNFLEAIFQQGPVALLRTLLFTHLFIQWETRRCWHMQMQLTLGTNMKMLLEKKTGSRLELLARKKGVRVVRDSLRKLYSDTLNRQ